MVKDPVCGMDIEPQDAVASREHMGHTFYFCSPNCVAQFDADPHRYAQAALAVTHAPLPVGSATTGFNPALPLARIDLPVLGLKREQDGRAVETAVRGLPGVRNAHANIGSGVLTVEYDPQRTTTAALAAGLRPAGFRAGGAQTRIGIEGLRCASCVGFIEDDLRATPGVLSAVRQRRHPGSHYRVPAPADHPGATARRHRGLGLPGPTGRERGAGRQARG